MRIQNPLGGTPPCRRSDFFSLWPSFSCLNREVHFPSFPPLLLWSFGGLSRRHGREGKSLTKKGLPLPSRTDRLPPCLKWHFGLLPSPPWQPLEMSPQLKLGLLVRSLLHRADIGRLIIIQRSQQTKKRKKPLHMHARNTGLGPLSSINYLQHPFPISMHT